MDLLYFYWCSFRLHFWPTFLYRRLTGCRYNFLSSSDFNSSKTLQSKVRHVWRLRPDLWTETVRRFGTPFNNLERVRSKGVDFHPKHWQRGVLGRRYSIIHPIRESVTIGVIGIVGRKVKSVFDGFSGYQVIHEIIRDLVFKSCRKNVV